MDLRGIFIYAKDVQRITGKSDKTSRNILTKARSHYKKQNHQLLTLNEFCEFMGIKVIEVSHLFSST